MWESGEVRKGGEGKEVDVCGGECGGEGEVVN